MISTRLLAYALAATLPATSLAQDTTAGLASRFSYSVSVIQSRPQGELARRVGLGYGASGSLSMRLDERGIWSLRGDFGAAQYNRVSRDYTLGDVSTDGLRLTLNTSSYVVPLSLGPQITWPSGILRPYANVGVATQGFFTETSVEGDHPSSGIASTTNRSDFVQAVSFGGGAYFVLPIRRKEVQIDLGFQKLNGSRATYLVPAANPDGSGESRLAAVSSDAHLLVLKLGARIAW